MVRSRLVLEENNKMAARRQSKVTPKYKTKYRVRNWAAYEKSLCRRGDITVWFDDDAVASWNAAASGLPGGQQEYSDLAILTSLTLRSLFHLGLRQTEGFVGSLMRLMRLELSVPDHTTLSRRGRTVIGQAGEAHVAEAGTDGVCCPDPHHLECKVNTASAEPGNCRHPHHLDCVPSAPQ